MSQRHRGLMKEISDGIRDRNRNRQSGTRECIRVLDEIIRPAMRQADNEIERHGENLYFYTPNNPPSIVIDTDQLSFNCKGNSVLISTKINGQSSVDVVHTRDMSEDLVMDKIARFLSMHYDFPVSTNYRED